MVYDDAKQKRMKEVSNAIAADIGGTVVSVGSISPYSLGVSGSFGLEVCSDAMTADEIRQALRQHPYPEVTKMLVREVITTWVIVRLPGDVGCWIRELGKESEIVSVSEDEAFSPL